MNHLARALVLLWMLARSALAQVSPSIVTDFPMAGSGSTSSHLRLTNTCASGQVLSWNGAAWVCSTVSGGGGGGTITGIVTPATSGLTGGCVLGTCTLTLLTSCAPSQVLQWNGTTWGCASISGGGGGISGLTATKVPVALNSTTLVDGSWTDTGTVLSTSAIVDLMGEQRDGVSYATLPSGVTKDWDPFGGGPATPVVVVTVNNSDSTVDSIDASKFSPLCLSNKAPKLRLMHDATNHGTLFLVNREGSTSSILPNKIDLPSNSPTTVAMTHRQVIDLEYQCPLNTWKVVGNQEAMWGGSAGFSASITDTTLGALVTDYQPTGYDTAAILRLGPTGASATIASMAARNDSGNRIQFVKCIVALGTIIIQDTSHSAGTAQWRFLLPGNADLTLPAYTTACFRYDAQQTYWMLWNGPGLLSSGGTISGLTTGTLPIATSATTIGNSHETESGGLFRVGSTALTVDYTTGAIVANTSLSITGAANTNTITPTNTAAGQTTTNALVSAVKLGSFNTTAGSLFSYGGLFEAQSTKSAGGNTLFNVGVWADARSGDANYALYADAGNVQLNASSGTTSIGGATTLSSTLAVTSSATADGGLRLFDIAGTGLASSANTVSLNINSGSTQTCSAGNHISALTSAGIATCSADAGGSPSVISPAQLVANTNDWAPTGVGTATTINVDTSNTWQITGISAGTDGRQLVLHNIGANSFYLITASASSAAANRFSGGSGAYLIQAGTDVQLEYRGGATNRWIVQFVGGQFNYDFYNLNSFTVTAASATFTAAATIGTTLGVTGLATFSGGASATSVSVTGAGKLSFTGQIQDAGTAATPSACGTSPSFTGGATSGTITTGSATGTSCTITFGITFTTTPSCIVESRSTTKGYSYTTSTTTLTLSSTISSTAYDFICFNH